MDRAPELIELLAAEPITAAWLFGSHARNAAGPLSDVDVGILADSNLSSDARFAIIGRLAPAVATCTPRTIATWYSSTRRPTISHPK